MIVLVLLPGPIVGVLYTMPLFLEPSEDTFKLQHGSYHTWSIAAATGYSELLACCAALEFYLMDKCTPHHTVYGQVGCAEPEFEVRSYAEILEGHLITVLLNLLNFRAVYF